MDFRQRWLQKELWELAELLDTNFSGSLSFLELARGLRDPETALPARVSAPLSLLEHREALLRACRGLDAQGTGWLPRQD